MAEIRKRYFASIATTEEEKKIILKACEITDEKNAVFIRESALKEATKIIKKHEKESKNGK